MLDKLELSNSVVIMGVSSTAIDFARVCVARAGLYLKQYVEIDEKCEHLTKVYAHIDDL